MSENRLLKPSMRVVIYSRVSTDAQERDGTSLDTQERACIEYAQAKGWIEVETVRDTASGSDLDRPGVERVRQLLDRGLVDVVLAYAVDRLSRNQIHIAVLLDDIERADATLEFVTEDFQNTPVGRLILNVRAFAGEVEREKIAERTMRGKLERARAGKLPQGTGKGCYGYRYNSETGRREKDSFQAVIVQRIFQRYIESQSFSRVSNELNEAGVPAFLGGQWYPLTIRRILMNETYTGRVTYRKTKRLKLRRVNGQGPISKVVDQPQKEWVLVKGSTPRIINEELWQRVQEILNDPERTRLRSTSRHYALRGRLKCGICGSAMVGQTLTPKGKPYKYYRCRHVYDKNSSKRCTAKYVDGIRLEEAVWTEMKGVLTNPGIVLQELRRTTVEEENNDEEERVERALADLNLQEKRLVDLYTIGGITAAAVSEKSNDLSKQRKILETQLSAVQTSLKPSFDNINLDDLQRVCEGVAEWVDRADEEDRRLALDALGVSISATKGSVAMSGMLPLQTPEFISNKQSSQCSFNGSRNLGLVVCLYIRFHNTNFIV